MALDPVVHPSYMLVELEKYLDQMSSKGVNFGAYLQDSKIFVPTFGMTESKK